MRNVATGLLIIAVLAGFVFGCNETESPAGEPGVACTFDDDCVSGTRCEWSRCRTVCHSVDDCSAPLTCHPTGVCTECAAQVDCDADTYCFRGMCLDASELDSDVAYGVECSDLGDCLNGEICLNTRCTPLCESDYDCRPPRGHCGPDNFCGQCFEDTHCQVGSLCIDNRCVAADADNVCDPSCDAGIGEYCDADSKHCKTVGCLGCDKDSDCAGAERCYVDRAVNGNRLCLIEAKTCPDGYAPDEDGVCRPRAMCPDVDYALLGQPCLFAGDDTLAPCAKNLRCMYNSRVSFCSKPCEAAADCAGDFENGCCGSFGNGEPYCLTETFCEMLEE